MKSRKMQKAENNKALYSADGRPVVRVSVRRLVEFVLRSGDIISGGGIRTADAALAGGRIHRKLQREAGENFRAEVPLSHDEDFDEFVLRVEGRADGILESKTKTGEYDDGGIKMVPAVPGKEGEMATLMANSRGPTVVPGKEGETAAEADETSGSGCRQIIIEEIKGMYLDVHSLDEPFPLHLAQAKCYAFIYAEKEALPEISVRMTYANLASGEVRHFPDIKFTFSELAEWFGKLTAEYAKWVRMDLRHKKSRDESIRHLEFPFAYRKGQKGLAAAVYKAVRDSKNIFLMAPTGVGKTMSCIFPSVIAMGQGIGDRIFYLTGKNETLSAPAQAFRILLDEGLDFKIIRILSKEKICPLSEPKCDPENCPYAKGHFDRVGGAAYELLTSENRMLGSDIFRAQSEKYRVCPFELELDTASFCDAVLCDYNYVFDPNAKLDRFFGQGARGDYIFLIDEAHNLVDRGRDMYSASLSKAHVLSAKRALHHKDCVLEKALDRVNKELLGMKHELENAPDGAVLGQPYKLLSKKAESGKEGEIASDTYAFENKAAENSPDIYSFETLDALNNACAGAFGAMQDFYRESQDAVLKEKLLDFYFELNDFVQTVGYLGPDYQAYAALSADPEGERGAKHDLEIRYLCANPAARLGGSLKKGRSAVFFSATLLPIDYYRKMLSEDISVPAVYAPSPFDTSKRLLLIGTDVSVRFSSRGPETYREIAAYISEAVHAKTGNYIIFFPSYKMMRDVFDIYLREFDSPDVNYVCQSGGMREDEREIFMENFYENPEKSLAAFAVMGGMFSEGIDLTGTKLIGAIIVGTGMPQVSVEREVLKNYYGKSGFDYAYRFPGMNKAEQAAGRVIRTSEDRGVILLLDSRFAESASRRLFPREWKDAKYVTLQTAKDELEQFWNKENDDKRL